jgi:hypothetical protein
MLFRPGAIQNPERYKQLYDHSDWYGVLPNRITPSDIDVVFDNKLNARILFCDFTSAFTLWKQKKPGQKILYEQLLRTNNYANACVLCYHEVPVDAEINTLTDVKSFHVMRITNRDGCIRFFPNEHEAYSGDLWSGFVKSFYGLSGAWHR